MKALQFTFAHPVKGSLQFRALSGQTKKKPGLQPFETGPEYLLMVQTEDLEPGSWELVLEWEYEDRSYQHTCQFEIEEETRLFKTARYADASLYHSQHPLHDMNR